MILYKGSKLNMSPFQPQPVHPDDYHKFLAPIPQKVLFASDSEIEAKIFATFSGIIPFETHTTSKKPNITIILNDEIEPIALKEKVYLYKFDSKQDGWKYIKESREWYNQTEQTPIGIQEYTREDLYTELKENHEIIFKEHYQKEEYIPIT